MRWSLSRRLLAYAAVALLLWYSMRGIRLSDTLAALRRADLLIFLPISLAGFLIWFFGETLLFARLFSYFHKPTRFRELLPANAGFYFLQLVNLTIANSALMFFLNQRKDVPWTAAGFTLLFQGFLDITLLGAMALLAVALGLDSPLAAVAPYALVVLLGGLIAAVTFLSLRPKSGLGKWLYRRPALATFRQARPYHYLVLSLIRLPIFLAEGFILYGELHSFHVPIPLYQAMLFAPAALLVGSLPLAPVGLGTLQLVFVKGLAAFAPEADLFAVAMAISFANLIWRLPLGLISIGWSARDQVQASGTCATVSL
ncbi:MAG: lysylphosphatidylglycerol synthase transmembrane domain-containing protein [Candidatus Binataceae bacterium]